MRLLYKIEVKIPIFQSCGIFKKTSIKYLYMVDAQSRLLNIEKILSTAELRRKGQGLHPCSGCRDLAKRKYVRQKRCLPVLPRGSPNKIFQ